jgi:hypothetical protein
MHRWAQYTMVPTLSRAGGGGSPPPPPPDLAGTRKETKTAAGQRASQDHADRLGRWVVGSESEEGKSEPGRTRRGPATEPRRRPFMRLRRPMSGTNPVAAILWGARGVWTWRRMG